MKFILLLFTEFVIFLKNEPPLWDLLNYYIKTTRFAQ